MTFRLGVVGHRETLETVTKLVDEYFDDVDVLTEEFKNDDGTLEAARRVDRLQTRCDGILYSRRDPYLFISGHVRHRIPVRYVDIDRSHLLISLLRANVRYGIRPTHLSVDFFDHGTVVDALQSVGLAKERLIVRPVTPPVGGQGMVKETLEQHIRNYEAGAELCMTNITDVYHSLKARDIPAVAIQPTAESFIHEIRNLMLRDQLRRQRAAAFALLHIRLHYKERYRYFGAMPIREVDDLNVAAKHLAVLADRLDGAMFQLSRWEYVVLCDRRLLEEETDRWVNIDVMRKIGTDTAFDATIGIGCGETLKEAEAHAFQAMHEAVTHGGPSTVVVLAPDQTLGPIQPKSERHPDESVTEANLEQIAADTGLSLHVVHRLYEATRPAGHHLFTSSQMAKTLSMSVRTVNRIVERLLDHDYARIEGRDLTQTHGRPARVIRLLF